MSTFLEVIFARALLAGPRFSLLSPFVEGFGVLGFWGFWTFPILFSLGCTYAVVFFIALLTN